MKQNLSKNEGNVLKLLVADGRSSCTDIGKKLGITSQAVGKIKDKLEEMGVISGYHARVDFEKLGVDVYAIAFFKFKSGEWSRLERQDIQKRVKGPHILNLFRLQEGEYTHMVIYAFRSMKELDHYFHLLQTERSHISELKKVYVLSSSSVFKDSPNELVVKLINEQGSDVLASPEIPPE